MRYGSLYLFDLTVSKCLVQSRDGDVIESV